MSASTAHVSKTCSSFISTYLQYHGSHSSSRSLRSSIRPLYSHQLCQSSRTVQVCRRYSPVFFPVFFLTKSFLLLFYYFFFFLICGFRQFKEKTLSEPKYFPYENKDIHSSSSVSLSFQLFDSVSLNLRGIYTQIINKRAMERGAKKKNHPQNNNKTTHNYI